MVDPALFDYDIYGYATLDLWLVREENRQRLTITRTGVTTGSWVATFHGEDSPAIDIEATPDAVQAALNAIPSLATAGGCRVSGTAGDFYVIDWLGSLANDVQELLLGTASFTPIGAVTAAYTIADLTGCTAKSTIRTVAGGAELLTMDTAGGTILLGGNGPFFDGSDAAAPTLTTQTTGGGLWDDTYYVRTSWITAYGESYASPEATIVIPAGTYTNKITVTTAALPAGVIGIKVYVSLDPSHTQRLVATSATNVALVLALPAETMPPIPTTNTTMGAPGTIRILVPASVTGATLAAVAWPSNYKAATDFHLTWPGAPEIVEPLYEGTVTYHPGATH